MYAGLGLCQIQVFLVDNADRLDRNIDPAVYTCLECLVPLQPAILPAVDSVHPEHDFIDLGICWTRI